MARFVYFRSIGHFFFHLKKIPERAKICKSVVANGVLMYICMISDARRPGLVGRRPDLKTKLLNGAARGVGADDTGKCV